MVVARDRWNVERREEWENIHPIGGKFNKFGTDYIVECL